MESDKKGSFSGRRPIIKVESSPTGKKPQDPSIVVSSDTISPPRHSLSPTNATGFLDAYRLNSKSIQEARKGSVRVSNTVDKILTPKANESKLKSDPRQEETIRESDRDSDDESDSKSSDKQNADVLNVKDETNKNKKRLESKRKLLKSVSKVFTKPKYLFMIKDTIIGKWNTSVKRSNSQISIQAPQISQISRHKS